MWLIIVVITFVGFAVGSIWDGVKTDKKVEELEERVKQLENK